MTKLQAWVALFFINDFGFAALQGHALPFYLFDYAVRILVLVWILKSTTPTQRRWKLPALRPGVPWTIFIVFLGVFQDRLFDRYLVDIGPHLFSFPLPPSAAFRVFDLTFGIALVALSEETLFRGILDQKYKTKKWARFLVPSLLFAGMHWGLGVKSVVGSWVWSIAPTLSVAACGSIWPAVVGHFVTDVVAFW